MLRFYLYRLKLISNIEQNQNLLPITDTSKADLLEKLIMLRPGAVVRGKIEWTVADTEKIEDEALFFNFGRITKKQKTHFDRDGISFFEMLDDDIEHVYCFYDCKMQVLAIEWKSSSPLPATIARYIEKVLNFCKENKRISVELTQQEKCLLSLTRASVDSISDPVEFIEYLKSSYKVTLFEVVFGPDNPYDFDKTLQRPMHQYLADTGGEKAAASVFSPSGLNKEKIIEISHAAAAYGDTAKAKVYHTEDSVGETIRLKKKSENAFFEIAVDNVLVVKTKVLNLLREKYRKIRDPNS